MRTNFLKHPIYGYHTNKRQDVHSLIKEQDILKEVTRVANEINRDLAGKNPLFLSVLNGSFMFTADLLKRITIPCEISFVKLASYQGVSSTGVIKEVIGINEDLTDRTVVICRGHSRYGTHHATLYWTPFGTRGPREISYFAFPTGET